MNTIPYIKTMQDEKYFNLVTASFKINDLSEYFKFIIFNKQIGWNEVMFIKDKTKIKFFNDSNFYEILINSCTKYILPFPKTINDFICDCHRCSVNLQWNDDILNKNDKKIFMYQNKLEDYFDNLLIKINKK